MSDFSAGFLIALVCLSLGVALAALSALAKFSIAQGRFDLDALTKAWSMRRAIDEAVAERVVTANVVTAGARPKAGPQPPDPNVQERRVLDEVAELEREMNRVTSSNGHPPKRDRSFRNEQPPQMEV